MWCREKVVGPDPDKLAALQECLEHLLTYLLTTAKLSATDHRWLSSLASFDFTIIYRVGKSNGDADGLSRMPRAECLVTPTEIPDEEYSKPFLARVQLPEEENMCTSD